MKSNPDNQLPLSNLSNQHELTLFLIQQELRATKFTNVLGQLGFDHSAFASDLGVAILLLVGFTERSDELWIWYYDRLDFYADKIDLQDGSLDKEVAKEFWKELRGRVEVMM